MRVITCGRCNGRGWSWHCTESEAWTEPCEDCNGTGTLEIISDDIIVDEDMVYITKKEYEKLLEYKHMYEDLCK